MARVAPFHPAVSPIRTFLPGAASLQTTPSRASAKARHANRHGFDFQRLQTVSLPQRERGGSFMHGARSQGSLSISRRHALALIGATAVASGAGAAEAPIFKPATLDHVNIRVTDPAKSAAFYAGLFDTPVLRNPALRARPALPPSEAFFLRMGEGYLAISQAFAPDKPDLDHYSIGIDGYDQAKLAARLSDSGIAAESRSVDVWARDLDGSYLQLRAPGGWARQTAQPYADFGRTGPALSPLSMSRIGLRCVDLARAGDFYGRLIGTEIAAAASGRARSFGLGDAVVELIAGASGPALDHIRVAVKDFSAESAARVLRERGIAMDAKAAPGSVRIVDPDGIAIEIAAGR
jgi:catechol 2,3-dioxygenase-like lactoylglutathione lyase family enzyme